MTNEAHKIGPYLNVDGRNVLRCECCGVSWEEHDNVLQTCKKLDAMKIENQKLKDELKTLRLCHMDIQ